jgi:thioredoxin-like negative regulator of GroEL
MAAQSRLEQIEAMLREEPNDPELGYMLAMEHASAGNDSKAAECFQALIQRCPDYPPGYHQAGRALVRLGRIEEAKSVLQQGVPAALKKNDQHAAGEMQELLESLD